MKKLLYILILIPFFGFSQEESRESKLNRFWAQEEHKKAIEDTTNSLYYFKKELVFYLTGEKLGEYPYQSYYSMLRTCQNIIKLESNDSIIKNYYDTINIIQNKMEKRGILRNISYKTRVNWYAKGNISYKNKIDSIYLAEMYSNTTLTNNELLFYYSNLYFLHKESGDSSVLSRIYTDYMSFLSDSNDLTAFYPYFRSTYNNIDRIDLISNDFLTKYSQDYTKIGFMLGHLEENGLDSTNFYENCVNYAINLDNTPTNSFKLANFYKKMGKNDEYEDILAKIKVNFPEFKDEINYNECISLYNSGDYRKTYDLSLKIGGKYRGNSLKLAGVSVALLANKSGISTFERKCNYYYAIKLLESAQNYGVNTSDLISQYTKLLPTEQDKFTEGNPTSIELTTWGVTVSIY